MRLTNLMMMRNTMRNLNDNTNRLDRLNNELSTGKKISVPSDDPVNTLRSMQLNSVLAENEQYGKNIGQAKDWLETTDQSLDKVVTTLNRVRDLTVYGSSDNLNQSQRDALSDELLQLREHLVQVANTSMGGRYIFSGYKTTTKPYEDWNQPYQGDGQVLSVEIGKGVGVNYSVPGDEIFADAFTAITNLISDMSTGNTTDMSQNDIGEVQSCLDNVLTIRAGIGAKVKRLELADSRFEEAKVEYTKHISDLEDVDIAETIMNLKMQENVYRASLAVNARILQPSLMDFMR